MSGLPQDSPGYPFIGENQGRHSDVREAEVGGRGQWFSVVPGKRAEAGPGGACSPELLNTPVQKVPVGGRGMILGF